MPRRALAIRPRSGAISTLRAVAFELATCRTAPQRDARMPQPRKPGRDRWVCPATEAGTIESASPPIGTCALLCYRHALIVGVIMTNAAHRAIEHHDGVHHTHNFAISGLKAALGWVVILGLFLIFRIVWTVATRYERRNHGGLI